MEKLKNKRQQNDYCLKENKILVAFKNNKNKQMNKIVFLLISAFLFSCSDNPVPKPDQLLEEEVMVDILYDTALLQATEAYLPEKLTANGVKIKNYIYLKYDIDSTTYYQNQRYYAADAKKYKNIYNEVIERIDANKTEIDTLIKKEVEAKKEEKKTTLKKKVLNNTEIK